MILHDAGHTNIVNTDSLKEFQYFQNKKFKRNSFDLRLTNPPFGARVKGSEKAASLQLVNQKLGNNQNKVCKSHTSQSDAVSKVV